uniref:Uncharacterized protein n=1 Tax=Arundo donax TaxID=35708 RepID=A0A0A9CZQ4_ARUDO
MTLSPITSQSIGKPMRQKLLKQLRSGLVCMQAVHDNPVLFLDVITHHTSVLICCHFLDKNRLDMQWKEVSK